VLSNSRNVTILSYDLSHAATGHSRHIHPRNTQIVQDVDLERSTVDSSSTVHHESHNLRMLLVTMDRH